jgi:hypothetical protein
VAVDVVGQLDEPEAQAESPLHPPGQIRRVNGQAVVSYSRAGREWHEPPNGLVDVALIVSHTSTPSSCPNIASSFASAMFTCRKVFSISLASSATHGEDTGTVRSTIPW